MNPNNEHTPEEWQQITGIRIMDPDGRAEGRLVRWLIVAWRRWQIARCVRRHPANGR